MTSFVILGLSIDIVHVLDMVLAALKLPSFHLGSFEEDD